MKVLSKLALAFFLLALICLSTAAHAKISFGEKDKTLSDAEVIQLKGFIYDAWSTVDKASERQKSGPDFAKALIWLDHKHAEKKQYNIMKIKTPEAAIVRQAMQFIVQFVNGKIHKDAPKHVVKSVMERWATIGNRTRAVYVKNNKGKVRWDLFLEKKTPTHPEGN